MSDAAQPNVQVYTRPRARDFGDMPLDTFELLDAISGLTSLQLGVYMRLRTSLWLRGALPVGLKALAAIGQVGPRAFERMMPVLGPLFDHDGDGRWHDHALERKRGNKSVLEVEERRVDPALSAKRSAAGKRGKEAQLLRLVSSRNAASEPGLPAADLANGLANGGESAGKTGLGEGVVDPPLPDASHGSIDRSSPEDSGKTDDRSIRAHARAGEAQANGPGNALANEPGAGLANGVGNGGGQMPGRSLAEVDEAALIAALRAAGGDKIPSVLLNAEDLAPLRLLVADGCELERDVVPAVANFANGCRGTLRTFGAGPIRTKALASRDAALADRARQGAATAALGTFVDEGTPAWRAWLRAKGIKSHAITTSQIDRTRRGWWFPGLWPPGWDEARLIEAERGTAR